MSSEKYIHSSLGLFLVDFTSFLIHFLIIIYEKQHCIKNNYLSDCAIDRGKMLKNTSTYLVSWIYRRFIRFKLFPKLDFSIFTYLWYIRGIQQKTNNFFPICAFHLILFLKNTRTLA